MPAEHKCSEVCESYRPRYGGNQPAIEHERRRFDAISRDSIVAAFPVGCRLGFIERDAVVAGQCTGHRRAVPTTRKSMFC